jgi:hypothetical protein
VLLQTPAGRPASPACKKSLLCGCSFAPNLLCHVGLCTKSQAGFAGACGAYELNTSSFSYAAVLSSCCHRSPSLHAHRGEAEEEGEEGVMARGRRDPAAAAQLPPSLTRAAVQERSGHHRSWRLSCMPCAVPAPPPQLLATTGIRGFRFSHQCGEEEYFGEGGCDGQQGDVRTYISVLSRWADLRAELG